MNQFTHRPYKRSDRLADQIKQILAELFIKEISIPGSGLLTVTKVKMTDDLLIAKVYISLIDEAKPVEKVMEDLIARTKSIRFLVGKQLTVKFVPKIHFYYDDTFVQAERIESLIRKLHTDEE